jgi:hypothetical protein
VLWYALFPLFSTKVPYKPTARKEGQEVVPEKAQPAQVPSPADYSVVAENNLFHPDRRIPPDKKEEKELPKPELALYGTVISADVSIAYVDDKKAPYTTPGRGKRLRVMKKGDVISGFVLKEIEPNKITLVRNEEVMTVNLDTTKVREEVGRAQPAPAVPRGGAAPLPAARTAGQPFPSQRALTPPAAAAPPAPAAVTPGQPQQPAGQSRIPVRQ